ncbi:aldo/keto reductase [Streptomyces sp. LP05-1]|uniref:Aldo/keto reductase n=1 Tax=Streptomyces pyxinae TaxID=2970734 RepID=A0ABT2CLP9_9ACTN|nr:aldo/keto reductase [Streptomyces sp. LP05-1]MCS0638354.1 aldo/keto reductase [Streptomyces sp. LP05-1]
MAPTRPLLEHALTAGVTALDTAFNYDAYAGHRVLARAAAGGLLEKFEVSTKVGYFPDGHTLEPARLRAAVERAAAELGRPPDTVLLHNPEHAPAGLAAACDTLAACRDAGLCAAWGIAAWNPSPLLSAAAGIDVRPDVLMVRAGLAVRGDVLDAAERLTLALGAADRWGMAPFAGNPNDPVWSKVDATVFLEPGQRASASRVQAGLAAAFALPAVSRIAVGTSSPQHLDELAAAVRYAAGPAVVDEYRELLRAGAGRRKGDQRAAHAHHG